MVVFDHSWRNPNPPAWPHGPWNDEPDKAQWRDAETGLACLIVRNPFGALCGYVGVPPSHPLHGHDYDEEVAPPPGWDVDRDRDSIGVVGLLQYAFRPESVSLSTALPAHGGITFSGACQPSEIPHRGICHVSAPGEPAVWWFGFDCAHFGDSFPRQFFDDPCGVYRDVDYVVAQCTRLARALANWPGDLCEILKHPSTSLSAIPAM